ncbi:MAG: hypothetical protein KGL39_54115 [Patescibacteria group bacterium]|nr:hypothetical protein [Patescibacteria group bacterium]
MKLAFLAPLALAGALAGCAGSTASLVSSTVNPNYAYSAVQAFNVAETTADGYLRLPACVSGGSSICRDYGAASKIVPLVRTGRAARNQVVAALHASNGAAIPVASYNNLQAIVATLQSVYTNYNIAPKTGG